MSAHPSTDPSADHSTDQAWRAWGEKDPYFGVITQPKFRRANLTPELLDEFFRSGQKHVDHILAMCKRYVDPQFKPKRALDFGCGVGRLLPALAAQAEAVVGVDISDAMLHEARENCGRLGVGNVTLLPSDDSLSAVEGGFDLVHSTIVLQHINPLRGRDIIAQLVARVLPGGIGALHLTYAKSAHANNHGAPPPRPAAEPPAPPGWRSWWPRAPLAKKPDAPAADPEMQMNCYPMNDVLFILQRAGVHRFHADFSDHGGELGMTLYFGLPRK
jgi:SAM-dependent methyltransferase